MACDLKRPAFQFYAGDWRSNAKLRRCSHAERGIWLEVLCLMHDSERYGVLDWPLKDIAQAVGCKVSELQSIVRKQVMKGAESGKVEAFIFTPRHAGKDGAPVTLIAETPGPLWYSSRMVRDEYIRTKRGESTRFESPHPAPDTTPKATPDPPIGASQGDGASDFVLRTSKNLKTKPNGHAAEAALVLPDWVPKEQWNAWIDARKKRRNPPTAWALKLALVKLEHWREEGHSVSHILANAAFNGYAGLWIPKEN